MPRFAVEGDLASCGARQSGLVNPAPTDGDVQRCLLAVSSPNGRRYSFSDSGLVYVTQDTAGTVTEHNYYVFPRGTRPPTLTREAGDRFTISRGGMNFTLRGDSGRISHITRGEDRTHLYPVSDTGASTELGISTFPDDALIFDLGESRGDGRGYDSIATFNPRTGACDVRASRSTMARIRGYANGVMQTCEIPVSDLFAFDAMDGRARYANLPVCQWTEADRTAQLAICDTNYETAIAAAEEGRPGAKARATATAARTRCQRAVHALGYPTAREATSVRETDGGLVRCVPRFRSLDRATVEANRATAGSSASRATWEALLEAGDQGLQDAFALTVLAARCPQLGNSIYALTTVSSGEAAAAAAERASRAAAAAEVGDCGGTVTSMHGTPRDMTQAECCEYGLSSGDSCDGIAGSADEGRSPDSAGRKRKGRKGTKARPARRAH